MKTLSKIFTWTVLTVFVAGILLPFTTPAASEGGLSVVLDKQGSLAPDFSFRNLLEQQVSLNDFRGQLILVGFAFKSDQKLSQDIEQFRQRIRSDFTDPEIPFLRVSNIDRPFFMSEDTILKKMRKGVNNDARLVRDTLVNFDMSLKLEEQYGATDIEVPWFFVIGKEGHILFACNGWDSEENVSLFEQELSKILEMGEEAYPENPDAASKGQQS